MGGAGRRAGSREAVVICHAGSLRRRSFLSTFCGRGCGRGRKGRRATWRGVGLQRGGGPRTRHSVAPPGARALSMATEERVVNAEWVRYSSSTRVPVLLRLLLLLLVSVRAPARRAPRACSPCPTARGGAAAPVAPAGERHVLDLDRREHAEIRRESRQRDPVHLVLYADLDLGQAIEHVELREVQRVVGIDHGRVAQHHQIEPPAAPHAARGGAELAPVVAPNSCPPDCRCSPAAMSCSVGKGPPPTRVVYTLAAPMVCPIAGEAEARADAADGGRGRGDVRLRAQVQVEHCGAGAFHEHALARRERLVQVHHAVDHVRLEARGQDLRAGVRFNKRVWGMHAAYLVPFDLALGVVFKVAVPLEAALDKLAELLGKGIGIERWCTRRPERDALSEYAGPMAFFVVPMLECTNKDRGSSKPRPAELDLFQSIDDLVQVKDEVGAIGDEEAAGTVEPCATQSVRCEMEYTKWDTPGSAAHRACQHDRRHLLLLHALDDACAHERPQRACRAQAREAPPGRAERVDRGGRRGGLREREVGEGAGRHGSRRGGAGGTD
jgi:hypothetical protein